MTLKSVFKIFNDKNCKKVYVKKLSPNDNSKNQVYLGGNFEVLNILPIKEITVDDEGDWNSKRFKTKVDFFWVEENGKETSAPHSQLILYPKYPEVRFSGFLWRTKGSHTELMNSRIDQRILFLGVTNNGKILGMVFSPESDVAREFDSLKDLADIGVFKEITLDKGSVLFHSKIELLKQLKRIHLLGWIESKRLDKDKNILPCISSNCGGYTLEAELGITPNGYSEPDYLGWEIKQFSVKNFSSYNRSIITLMTPEPTHGFYVESGVESFIKKYGYPDKRGREARMNFGGIYKYDKINKGTSLKLIVDGFDIEEKKIISPNGYIGLIDQSGMVAAAWSFTSLLKHWNTKHANACYVPSLHRNQEYISLIGKNEYYYGNSIILGNQTDFSLFLEQIINGNVYYDPGIKLEFVIDGVRKQIIKRRSQFRIKSGYLSTLYNTNEVVDINSL